MSSEREEAPVVLVVDDLEDQREVCAQLVRSEEELRLHVAAAGSSQACIRNGDG